MNTYQCILSIYKLSLHTYQLPTKIATQYSKFLVSLTLKVKFHK